MRQSNHSDEQSPYHFQKLIITFPIIFMISNILVRNSLRFMRAPLFRVSHIKNMIKENAREEAQAANDLPLISSTNKIYKPTHTVQFNREGEALLYSASPLKHQTIYLKYPYVLYESLIPLCILNYVLNPLDMWWVYSSGLLYGATFLAIPRVWQFSDHKYLVQKLFLMRGGRNLKIQAQSLSGDRFNYWIEIAATRRLTANEKHFDEADNDFLTEEGQLNHDVAIQVDNMHQFGVNTNNALLRLKGHGTVHSPQLFQAALSGYHIDDSDFSINTADNVRFHEGNHDH